MSVKYELVASVDWENPNGTIFNATINNVSIGKFEYLGYHDALEILVNELNNDDTNISFKTVSNDSGTDYYINDEQLLAYIPSLNFLYNALDVLNVAYTK